MSEAENKTEEQEDCWWCPLVAILGVLYFIASGFAALSGGVNAGRWECKATYRADYVFPTRKLGCWLGEETKASVQERHKQDE